MLTGGCPTLQAVILPRPKCPCSFLLLEECNQVGTRWEETGFLAQMVCLAASHAPNLTTSTLEGLGRVQPVLHSLAFLSQIQILNLGDLTFPQDANEIAGICGFSSLRSLQEISFYDMHLENATVNFTDYFWEALSRLPLLMSILLDAHGRCNFADGSPQVFFGSLPKMTKLSTLSVRYFPDTMDWDTPLCPAFASLTQLKGLDFKYYVAPREYAPVMSLPVLERLKLDFCSQDPVPDMHVASPHLTALEVIGCYASSVAEYLPLNTPCLSCLHTLRLPEAEICAFPDALASGLRSLVFLDLRGNSFERLPGALAHITTLECGDLSDNCSLQLVQGDAAIVGALSSLTTLYLEKSFMNCNWTAESVLAMKDMKLRFPKVDFGSCP